MKQVNFKKNQPGFIALITILLVSAVALVISSSILLKSITESTISTDEESVNKAQATVDACGEYALINLALASTTGYLSSSHGWKYTGGEPVFVNGNLCYINTIDISAGTSSPRTVHASSTVNNFTRKISIIVATNTPTISVTSWSSVADF